MVNSLRVLRQGDVAMTHAPDAQHAGTRGDLVAERIANLRHGHRQLAVVVVVQALHSVNPDSSILRTNLEVNKDALRGLGAQESGDTSLRVGFEPANPLIMPVGPMDVGNIMLNSAAAVRSLLVPGAFTCAPSFVSASHRTTRP